MDAAELKVVLSAIDERESRTIRALEHVWGERCESRAMEVCEKHGGHEFIDDNSPCALVRKVCKFCGKPEKQAWTLKA